MTTDQTESLISLVLDGMLVAVETVNTSVQGITFLPKIACSEEQIKEGLDVYEIREIAMEYRRKSNAKWN